MGTKVVATAGESKEQQRVRESAAAAAASAKAAADAKAEAEAKAAAEAKAEADAKAAADADLSTYKAIDDRAWALITKDPDSHIGEKYVLYGAVTQFDAATGTSSFRANIEANQQESTYEYETNTIVNAVPGADVSDIVEDDILKMYVKIEGSVSYDTQIGGSTTAPTVLIFSSELLGHEN